MIVFNQTRFGYYYHCQRGPGGPPTFDFHWHLCAGLSFGDSRAYVCVLKGVSTQLHYKVLFADSPSDANIHTLQASTSGDLMARRVVFAALLNS